MTMATSDQNTLIANQSYEMYSPFTSITVETSAGSTWPFVPQAVRGPLFHIRRVCYPRLCLCSTHGESAIPVLAVMCVERWSWCDMLLLFPWLPRYHAAIWGAHPPKRAEHSGQSISNSYIAPLFCQNGAKSGFEMCFDIGSRHLGCWGQNTSRIQNKGVYATLCLQALLTCWELPSIPFLLDFNHVNKSQTLFGMEKVTNRELKENPPTFG